MRRTTPRAALLTHLIHTALIPGGINIKCGTCKVYYDPSDPHASYPHNNH